MLSVYEIDHILESDEFTPRQKEMLLLVATFLHHVTALDSGKCEEFVDLFNRCAKPELLDQLDNLVKQYYKP